MAKMEIYKLDSILAKDNELDALLWYIHDSILCVHDCPYPDWKQCPLPYMVLARNLDDTSEFTPVQTGMFKAVREGIERRKTIDPHKITIPPWGEGEGEGDYRTWYEAMYEKRSVPLWVHSGGEQDLTDAEVTALTRHQLNILPEIIEVFAEGYRRIMKEVEGIKNKGRAVQ